MNEPSGPSPNDPSALQRSARPVGRITLCALVVLALITLLVMMVRSAGEPFCQGRPASDWFAQASDPTNYWWMQEAWVDPQLTPTPAALSFRQTLNAFVQMGPEVVPYLLGRLTNRRPDSTPGYKSFYLRVPLQIRRVLPRPRDREQERRTADLILRRLGGAASCGVPEFIHMIQSGAPFEEMGAINILKSIGPPASNAVSALTAVVAQTNEFLRVLSADALRTIAPVKTPGLLHVYRTAMTNANPDLRAMGARSLWEATREPDQVIPCLIPLLTDRRMAIVACVVLSQCGQNASNAVPGLLTLMDAPDLSLRVAAAIALSSVAPEVQSQKVVQVLASGRAARLEIGGLPYPADPSSQAAP